MGAEGNAPGGRGPSFFLAPMEEKVLKYSAPNTSEVPIHCFRSHLEREKDSHRETYRESERKKEREKKYREREIWRRFRDSEI